MYTRSTKFAMECGGVFADNQLEKIFLSNVDEYLIYLTLSKIVMDYGEWTILVEAFTVVKQCDRIQY